MSPQEQTMMECLSATGLRELPPKLDANEKRTWLRAIALCTKVGGIKNYVLCENDGHGHPNIKRDFGYCAAIVFVDFIYPYEFADNTIVPTFKDDNEIIHYLCKSRYDRSDIESLLSVDGKSPEQIEADRSEINRRINDIALSAQKSKIEEKKRVRAIKEYAEKVKSEKPKTNGRRKKKENDR